ncbi:hypothetical protein ILYODFUR_008026 [Ilyodon furcidens]|uniref:Uncharacterized protein n=1 Tax=Ilyodon furcidens TaxID=33524 RepID=A0ABV0UQA0_9TELE
MHISVIPLGCVLYYSHPLHGAFDTRKQKENLEAQPSLQVTVPQSSASRFPGTSSISYCLSINSPRAQLPMAEPDRDSDASTMDIFLPFWKTEPLKFKTFWYLL